MEALEPCPYLPMPTRVLTSDDIHALGSDRSARFYDIAMEYAQVLWLAGFPAKALLLVNRALGCRLPEVSLKPGDGGVKAAPYHAKAWLLWHRKPELFVGNPRRHYQHLATRMVEPHKELRTWRAWACWYLAKELLPEHEYPDDAKQVREEGIVKPTRAQIADHLKRLSPNDDVEAWKDALAMIHAWQDKARREPVEISIEVVTAEAAPVIRALAHEIWLQVYPAIISESQILYMLERMYGEEQFRAEMANGGLQCALLMDGGDPVGFLGWEMKEEGTLFLHKLYLKPALHGQGVGSKALAWLEARGREAGMKRVRLRVNRNNSPAIRAYRRAGFDFEEEVCTDIGGGFEMDDYVMGKALV